MACTLLVYGLPTDLPAQKSWLKHHGRHRIWEAESCGGTAQDVVVVVSRWFGGVLLGPQRFTIINNTARLMLEACGYDNRHATKSGPTSKPNSGGLARQ